MFSWFGIEIWYQLCCGYQYTCIIFKVLVFYLSSIYFWRQQSGQNTLNEMGLNGAMYMVSSLIICHDLAVFRYLILISKDFYDFTSISVFSLLLVSIQKTIKHSRLGYITHYITTKHLEFR